MPLVPDGRPGLMRIVRGDGRVLATYTPGRRDGLPLADEVVPAPGVGLDLLVPAVRSELAGCYVSGPEPLGQALLALGARRRRHAHLYSRDLRAEPAPASWGDPVLPPGVGLAAADALPPADLVPLWLAAYPAGHPDHLSDPPSTWNEVAVRVMSGLDGSALGPVQACSALALDRDGRPVGAVVVVDRGGEPPGGGGWVLDLVRDPAPELAGLGRSLLERALAVATREGPRTLGLAVTQGNPARRLYETLGFHHVTTVLNVVVPPMLGTSTD